MPFFYSLPMDILFHSLSSLSQCLSEHFRNHNDGSFDYGVFVCLFVYLLLSKVHLDFSKDSNTNITC